MKNIITFLIIFLLANCSFAQTYIPFPSDAAQWNQLNTWWEGGQWGTFHTFNYQYRLMGDTVIKGNTYSKVYRLVNELYPDYIGSLREDDNKNIFFYPFESYMEPNISFPNDTAEYLLYSFNNLEVGTILSINSYDNIEVVAIDSILLQDVYHKRYRITGNGMAGLEYWIEGIGSTSELFSNYTNEFESEFYTLCFKPDLIDTYYISSPDDYNWCTYNVGINEIDLNRFSVSPNPAHDNILIKGEIPEKLNYAITDLVGNILIKGSYSANSPIGIAELKPGIYALTICSNQTTYNIKFIKL